MPSKADNFSEAAGQTNAAANDYQGVKNGIVAAAKKDPQADKFAQNASSPTWVGGFDELLGSKRTT